MNQVRQQYCFGNFRVDPAERLLTRDGDAIRLPPKVFDTLVVLVESRGRLVAKDELITRIWPDTFIEEATLARNISDLRKALGQAADQKYIETIPKHGYRFVADVRELSPVSDDLVLEVHRTAHIVTEEIEPVRSGDVVESGHAAQPLAATMISSGPAKKARAGIYWLALGGAAAIIAAFALYLWRSESRVAGSAEVPSIAVLPFQPISSELRDEYLELGMADALITHLSSINRLVVRSANAVRKYAGTTADPIMAGRELKVEAVLEGNVQRAGDRILVRARLVRVSDGRALWTGEFDEKSADIFRLQDRISEQMADALALKLTGEEKKLLSKRYTENAEANELYQKGRFFWNKRTIEGLNKGAEYFERAITIDRQFALAYAGLADSYALLDLYGNLQGGDIFEKARIAAGTALTLDASLAEAHASLAYVDCYHDWNWAGAEQEFKRAISANPNYATAHQWYAEYLFYMARFDESIAEINRAHELDPMSLSISTEMGSPYYYMRQYETALEKYTEAHEMDPGFPLAVYCMALCYGQKSQFNEAIALLGRGKGGHSPTAAVGYFYGMSGQAREGREVLSDLIKTDFPPTNIARVFAGLGEKEQALAWLERAIDQRDERAVMLKVDPHFDSLRSDPRFRNLLGRLGLDQ
ncbi:MAG TPA: winged helix-turn-helix domain-containing protein [Blastocatellia bacterium]|nr:winged helix-turn-helix domain-containing protein [Blastocatellia bacterium]